MVAPFLPPPSPDPFDPFAMMVGGAVPGMGPDFATAPLPVPPGMGPVPGGAPPIPPGPMGPLQFLTGLPLELFENPQEAPPPVYEPTARPKPDLEHVRAQMDRIIDYWDPRNRRMDEDFQLYALTKDISGDGEVIVRNTPYTTVEKAANIIAAQTPQISVIPPRLELREEAQAMENFLRYSWWRWNKVWRRSQLQGSLARSMAYFLALRGWSANRVTLNNAEDIEEDPHAHPVLMTPYDPRQVYPGLGQNGGLRFVVHEYWTTFGELVDEWGDDALKLFENKKDEEPVRVRAYYDDWWHYVEADDQELKPLTAHEYGYVPWVIVTGAGSPIRATDTDDNHWTRDCGVSIFHGIRQAYEQLNKVLSQLATEVARAANPATLYWYDPASGEQPQPLDLAPGATNWLVYDRERAEPISLSPRPSDLAPLIDALVDDVNRGGLPPVVWGIGNVSSGLLGSTMSDAARDQLSPLIEGIQEAMEQINELALCLIRDHHDGEISFWVRDQSGVAAGGHTISPDDIGLVGVETEVRYRDVAPRDRVAMANIATMLTREKLISLETAREEYLGLDNPERENERVLTDLLYMDETVVKNVLVPWALSQFDPKMFEMWFAAKQYEEVQKQMKQAAPPGPPGPGGPPGLPPDVMAPITQPGADPLAQAIGSTAGGAGFQAPPGLPSLLPI